MGSCVRLVHLDQSKVTGQGLTRIGALDELPIGTISPQNSLEEVPVLALWHVALEDDQKLCINDGGENERFLCLLDRCDEPSSTIDDWTWAVLTNSEPREKELFRGAPGLPPPFVNGEATTIRAKMTVTMPNMACPPRGGRSWHLIMAIGSTPRSRKNSTPLYARWGEQRTKKRKSQEI